MVTAPHIYSLGLIGKTLTHSFSQKYFTDKFRREGIAGTYRLFEIPEISCLPDLLEKEKELTGFNVTIPFKESILPFLDFVSDEAARIGAVNTVLITHGDNGKALLAGYNTDAGGFKKSFEPLLEEAKRLHPRADYSRALIAGTGGAAKGVAYALRQLGVRPLFISRTPGKITGGERPISYRDMDPELIRTHRILINATPLGTFPDTGHRPALPYHLLGNGYVAYDLVYNPAVTSFMKECAAQGCIVKNGYEMLVNQAELAWELWKSLPD